MDAWVAGWLSRAGGFVDGRLDCRIRTRVVIALVVVGVIGPGGQHLCQQVDDDGAGAGVDAGGVAVGVVALAGEVVGSGADGAQCVGAALPEGAWVVVADSADHGVEQVSEQGRVGGQEPSPDGDGAVGIVRVTEMNITISRGGAGSAHGGGVEFFHPDIDGLFGLGGGQGTVGGGGAGQGGVDQCQGVVVGDELGAPGDRGDHFRRDFSMGEDGGDFGESFA